ncbi:MAG: hypothetical protein COA41_00445 [Sphingopyxis sp.]|nr:MAG: hypothetical protein COA41_00445 [Sphingopyxis sp.]
MAVEPITADMVNDAGIAASIAANANAIPEPSVYFQDFTFGGTMFDSAFGNVENLSGVGLGVADRAVDEMIRLAAEERKKDDPASDASMIAELGAQQREEIAEMQSVTYSNGQFHMFGMDIDEEDMDAAVDETLENIDAVAVKHGLDAQQKAELATLLMAYQNADTPEEKAEILGEIAEAQPEVAREMADQTQIDPEVRAQNNLSAGEQVQGAIATIEDDQRYEEANLDIADNAETASLAVSVRSGLSNAGNPFETGFSPTPEFNSQASGEAQLAQAEPVQTTPTVSGPALLNG